MHDFSKAAPKGKAIAMINRKHELIPLSDLQGKINKETRYFYGQIDVKIVTCNSEGLQEVFWGNYKNLEEVQTWAQ